MTPTPTPTPRTPGHGGEVALDVDGPAAPPRVNGELVFAAPWEGRAFGLVVTLAAQGRLGWEPFRAHLVARVADDPERPYWASWLAALEDALDGDGVLPAGSVDARVDTLAHRAAGHDHGHGHGHDHGH